MDPDGFKFRAWLVYGVVFPLARLIQPQFWIRGGGKPALVLAW
ncbi:hypothetical protein FLM9_450, partial [Candidatus Synechococcus spongiarum]